MVQKGWTRKIHSNGQMDYIFLIFKNTRLALSSNKGSQSKSGLDCAKFSANQIISNSLVAVKLPTPPSGHPWESLATTKIATHSRQKGLHRTLGGVLESSRRLEPVWPANSLGCSTVRHRNKAPTPRCVETVGALWLIHLIVERCVIVVFVIVITNG